MIKALICRGIGFTSGTKYIPTLGLAIGEAPLTAVFMTPTKVWGPL